MLFLISFIDLKRGSSFYLNLFNFRILLCHEGNKKEMNMFWEDVTQKTKNNLQTNDEQLLEALKNQKDEIIRFLSFNCYLDEGSDDKQIQAIKTEILHLYSESIAKSISKIEVYSHDLPPEIVEALFELLQDIVASDLTKGEENKKAAYTHTRQYAYFVKHLTELLLSESYFDRIKEYRNQLKNFNIKGVKMDDGNLFYIFANKEYTRLRKMLKPFKKTINAYLVRDNTNKSTEILYSTIQKDIGLEEYIKDLEILINKYEEYYPKIIHNGYNQPIWCRIMNKTIFTLATIITVISFLKIFGIIDVFFIIKSWFSIGVN